MIRVSTVREPGSQELTIRELRPDDWPMVWPIIREVLDEGDTYAYDPNMTEDEARAMWVERPPARTVIAEDGGQLVGTAKMGPNRPGPGSHVSTASFMVAANSRGRGVGRALCEDALAWARANGYAGMQFNAVAETNLGAVALYERLGFTIIGTVPGAFEHPTKGRVALHIMYCPFDQPAKRRR
jgi:ribosomal protein S18 acetylase RimI-like enzyme